VPLQAGPALEALPAGRTVELAGDAVVDPLVVVQDAGEAEGLSARQTPVLLLLRVDARVVAERHGVAEGLGAEGAAEGSRLVGVLVVQEGAGVAVAATAHVAGERPLLSLAAWRSVTGVGRQLGHGDEGLPTLLTLSGSSFEDPLASRPLLSDVGTIVAQ